jgi:hypothetical protein
MILLNLALATSGVTVSSTDHPRAGAHAVVVGSVSISPGVTMSAGVTVNGVDIGASLDASCGQATTSR